ncbi:MAG: EAL domain-containing protein, partial [Rhodanobacter sp.]
HRVPPERVCFEIAETVAVGQLTQVARCMARLRKIGCKIALDDFGTCPSWCCATGLEGISNNLIPGTCRVPRITPICRSPPCGRKQAATRPVIAHKVRFYSRFEERLE